MHMVARNIYGARLRTRAHTRRDHRWNRNAAGGGPSIYKYLKN